MYIGTTDSTLTDVESPQDPRLKLQLSLGEMEAKFKDSNGKMSDGQAKHDPYTGCIFCNLIIPMESIIIYYVVYFPLSF